MEFYLHVSVACDFYGVLVAHFADSVLSMFRTTDPHLQTDKQGSGIAGEHCSLRKHMVIEKW